MRKAILVGAIFFISLFFVISSYAQPGGGGPGGGGDPDAVPIGGLGWLLLTGILFGIKKLTSGNKKD